MDGVFRLSDKLRAYSKQINKGITAFRKGLEENAVIACGSAKRVAEEHTPHQGDGKRRGNNVITNALQQSWHVDCDIVNRNDRERIYALVTITNDKYYAPFVQYGHRMSVHFVPWLYIDGQRTISRSLNQSGPLFGLTVGRKTPFVKGVDMIGPAIEEFNNVFDRLNTELLKRSFKQ